jgi:thiol-disulfide isomerase/thioredoxin
MKKILPIIIFLILITINFDVISATKKAPGIALYNLSDKLITLSTLNKDSNVIISFWAGYCKPCKKEMPQLVELEKKYGEKKKIKLLFVNIDKEGKEKAQPVLDELKITDECLLDKYQVNAKKYIPDLRIPAVFLVNSKGNIVFEAVGESTENIANLEKAIQQL